MKMVCKILCYAKRCNARIYLSKLSDYSISFEYNEMVISVANAGLVEVIITDKSINTVNQDNSMMHGLSGCSEPIF